MPQRSDVMDHEHVSAVAHRGEVGRRVQRGGARGLDGQHGLLPSVPGAVGKAGGRPDHAVAIGSQRRQPARHLARQALDPADLGTDGGACVDRDDGRVRRFGHRYCGRTVRRSTSPEASRPTAIAAARPTSSPVRGSVEEDDGSADFVED